MDASWNAEANAHHVHYITSIDCNNLIPVSVPLHEGTCTVYHTYTMEMCKLVILNTNISSATCLSPQCMRTYIVCVQRSACGHVVAALLQVGYFWASLTPKALSLRPESVMRGVVMQHVV